MRKEPWEVRAQRFDHQPVRSSIRAIGAGWVLTLVVIGLVLIIGVLLWAFGVFTSDIKGAGGLHIRLSSPDGETELTGDAAVAWGFLTDSFGILAPCPARWCGDCEECAAVSEALDRELDSITREAPA